MASDERLAPGSVVGRYRIMATLGVGRLGAVYRAREAALDRIVALKIVRDALARDPLTIQRLLRHVELVGRLDHPNIAQILDVQLVEHRWVLACEYFESGTLAERVSERARSGDPMRTGEIVRVISDTARALDHAHENGVVHLGLTPSNILFAADGTAVVSDFGIGAVVGSGADGEAAKGRSTFDSPESEPGPVDRRADVYSLGAIAYVLIHGSAPSVAEPDRPSIPRVAPVASSAVVRAGVDAILQRALSMRPADRPASAGELAREFGRALDPDRPDPESTTLTRMPRAGRGERRRGHDRTRLAVAAVVVLLAAATGSVASPFVHTPTSVATPASASAPVPARGRLIYQAQLDGTTNDVRLPLLTAGDPDASEIRFVSGAIELVVLRETTPDQAGIGINFNVPARVAYVGEFQLAVMPKTRATVFLKLRDVPGPGYPRYTIELVTRDAYLELGLRSDPTVFTPLAPRALVPDLALGRPFVVSVVARPGLHEVYLEGELVARTTDDRLIAAAAPAIFIRGSQGEVRLLAARIYEAP